MVYNLFPAVDENFDFPQQVRAQLAKSPELRNMILPMTTAVRDALDTDEKWNGRAIYNLTSQRLETWNQNLNTWVGYLDQTYSFPEPPPLWDENYDIKIEVRRQLAKSNELRHLVIPMSESVKANLSAAEKWDGRIIYNTTSERLELWTISDNKWHVVLDERSMLDADILDKLSQSDLLKNMVKPMSTSTRDSLTNDQVWEGRVIYNTTDDQVEVFTNNRWVRLLDDESIVSQDIIEALSQTSVLRNILAPMTKLERDLLPSQGQLWEGRVIYNTTDDQVEVFKSTQVNEVFSSSQWVKVLDQTSILDSDVLSDLAKTTQLRNMILPTTQTDINTNVVEKWDGRVIYNTTLECLQYWNSNEYKWVSIFDEHSDLMGDWISFSYEEQSPITMSVNGRYRKNNNITYFECVLTALHDANELSSDLSISIPLHKLNVSDGEASGIGNYIYDCSNDNQGRYHGYALCSGTGILFSNCIPNSSSFYLSAKNPWFMKSGYQIKTQGSLVHGV